MKLYFIRHGKTEFNEQGRLQGHADSALTIDGIKDSQNLAKFFLSKMLFGSELSTCNWTNNQSPFS